MKYPFYKFNKGEIILLTHLIHLETRILEQSLITKFQPKLNVSQEVLKTHASRGFEAT